MGNLDHWDHKNASVRLSRISEERNDFTHGVMFSIIRTYHHFELVLVAEFCDFLKEVISSGASQTEAWLTLRCGKETNLEY